jgi:hypothetical protein
VTQIQTSVHFIWDAQSIDHRLSTGRWLKKFEYAGAILLRPTNVMPLIMGQSWAKRPDPMSLPDCSPIRNDNWLVIENVRTGNIGRSRKRCIRLGTKCFSMLSHSCRDTPAREVDASESSKKCPILTLQDHGFPACGPGVREVYVKERDTNRDIRCRQGALPRV